MSFRTVTNEIPILPKEDESEPVLPGSNDNGAEVQWTCWDPRKKAGYHPVENGIWVSWLLALGSIYRITFFCNFYSSWTL